MLATEMRKKLLALQYFLIVSAFQYLFIRTWRNKLSIWHLRFIVDDDDDVFDVHHHHDSNESDLDRMAERKNEAENVPTQLWLLFARNLREGGNINFEESTQIGTNDKKSQNVTAYFWSFPTPTNWTRKINKSKKAFAKHDTNRA